VIILDTNVLSALMRDPADAQVSAWLDRQDRLDVWTSSVTVFELQYGIARLAEGRQRRALDEALGALVRVDLAGRVAPLDRAAGEAAGRLAAARMARGRAVEVQDVLVAGIAVARRAVVATRNVWHFDDLETGVVDPWGATG